MSKEKITAYKGFEKDMKCRGFQYEVGKEYEQDDASVCNYGFHACENPLDVLDYYSDIDGKYCIVESSGKIDKDEDGKKFASSRIKIVAEIGFVGLFKAGIEWLKEVTSPERIKETKETSSGDSAQIGSSGDYAKIGSSGYYAQIGSSGDYAKIGSSGYYAQIGSSGDSAQIGSSGDSAKIGSSGDYAQIGSSGNYAQIGSSGDYAQIGSSGYSAKIGSSGNYAQIGSSDDYAQIGSSGNYAQIGSSGDSAQIGSSGYSAKIDSTGEDSVICCAGNNSKAKAKIGSWITLSEWVYSEDKKKYIPKCVKSEYVDGERIKADTWYKLIDGEFVEQ